MLPIRSSVLGVLLALAIGAPPFALARHPEPAPTLCVLDFNRLGEDASMDWLERGMSDMMITTMNHLSPYPVVEREHLKQLLAEHGLAMTGVVDVSSAVQKARLAKAQMLLLGNFVRREGAITIQARLLRLSDQKIVAMATWKGPRAAVLDAPRHLTRTLLGNLKQPLDPALLAGIENQIPHSVDAARAYYLGVGAFDEGRYPDALAHYLEAAGSPPRADAPDASFLKSYRAVIQMYYLLDRSEHAVAFAYRVARKLEAEHAIAEAMEFYFAAGEKCTDPLENHALAAHFLGHAVRLAQRSDAEGTSWAKARDALVLESPRLNERVLTGVQRLHLKTYRLLLREFTWGMDDEPKLQEKIDYYTEDGGRWVSEPYPYPSVLMWWMRAQKALARALARAQEAETSLGHYRELFDRTAFLASLPDPVLNRWGETIKGEAHFVLLDQYARTGSLIRNHAFAKISPLNVLEARAPFVRKTPHRDVDRRARTASRYPGRGHEFFDFASPEGFELRSLTLTTRVAGLAEYSFYVPDPKGWPPQYSFSRRLQKLRFWKGTHTRKLALPPGTEIVSMGAHWGRGMFDNSALDVHYHKLLGPPDDQDIVSWQLDFEFAPRTGKPEKPPPRAGLTDAERKLIARFVSEDGWSDPTIVRDVNVVPYTGNPPADVYSQDWIAFSVRGDIQIHKQADPRVVVRLPTAVNTSENEFDPSLVRTHEGGYALLWSRGADRRVATRFVARTQDLLAWETPQRMVFEPPADTTRYTYESAEPLERSFNVCPVEDGYVMLLAQGFVRRSRDLKTWDLPRRALPQDLLENRMIRTRDGRLWAAFETSSPELRPYSGKNWLSGYFVTDGKQYEHLCEIHLAWSRDGVQWHLSGQRTFEGQSSDLWMFPLSDARIAIAAQFNRAFVRWLTSDGRTLDEAPSVVALKFDSPAVLYAENARVGCIRSQFDYFDEQRSVLIRMSSKKQMENLLR